MRKGGERERGRGEKQSSVQWEKSQMKNERHLYFPSNFLFLLVSFSLTLGGKSYLT